MIRFLRRVWPIIPVHERRRIRRTAIGAIVLALFDAAGVSLVFPLVQLATSDPGEPLGGPVGWLRDLTGIDDRGRLALAVAVAVVILFVGKGILAVLLLRSNIQTAHNCEIAVARRLVRGYLHAPLTFHLSRNSAELQRTLNDSLRRVFQDALATTVPAIGDRVILYAVGLVLVLIAPLEAIVGTIWFAGLMWFYRRLTHQRVSASSVALVEESRHGIQGLQQALVSVREVTISGRAEHVSESIVEYRRLAASRQKVLTLTEQLPRYYLEIGLIGGAAVVSAVAFQIRDSEAALAILGLFVAAGLRMLPSMNRSLNAEGKARVAAPNLDAIEADLAATPDPDAVEREDVAPLAPDEPFRELLLVSTGFAYGARAAVLKGIDLKVEAGETIGIVGGSGAGKSTLISLFLGLLDPTEGEILVNGRRLADCRSTWQHRVGYVPQTVAVLDTDILENVAFGCPPHEIDEARVAAAVTAAQLDEFVAQLPDGLRTSLGESGARMSGGQRQRLGLARALYDEPQLLVLDEATSSLDGTTERRILQTLEGLRSQVTMIIVSHRHSTIRSADRILHLAGGEIRSQGSYDELVRSDAEFVRLAQLDDEDERLPGGP